MRVLIFGAGGQVGRDVCRAAWPSDYTLSAFDHSAVDITEGEAVADVLRRERPDTVINLAAYTAVDRAESESEKAWAVNCRGAAYIAAACERARVPLIHLSTDYVFDGLKTGPYDEDDPVNPLGVYARSKEAGERAVRAALGEHIIIRTAWVYGVHGGNFVKTMLKLGTRRPILRVVADRRGSPTAAADIAAALTLAAERIRTGDAPWGTFHFAGAGPVTWYDFAVAIFGLAASRLGAGPRIEPITTDEYPTAARRPLNSVLDCRKIEKCLRITPPSWRIELARVVSELLDQRPEAQDSDTIFRLRSAGKNDSDRYGL